MRVLLFFPPYSSCRDRRDQVVGEIGPLFDQAIAESAGGQAAASVNSAQVTARAECKAGEHGGAGMRLGGSVAEFERGKTYSQVIVICGVLYSSRRPGVMTFMIAGFSWAVA